MTPRQKSTYKAIKEKYPALLKSVTDESTGKTKDVRSAGRRPKHLKIKIRPESMNPA